MTNSTVEAIIKRKSADLQGFFPWPLRGFFDDHFSVVGSEGSAEVPSSRKRLTIALNHNERNATTKGKPNGKFSRQRFFHNWLLNCFISWFIQCYIRLLKNQWNFKVWTKKGNGIPTWIDAFFKDFSAFFWLRRHIMKTEKAAEREMLNRAYDFLISKCCSVRFPMTDASFCETRTTVEREKRQQISFNSLVKTFFSVPFGSSFYTYTTGRFN